MKLSDIITLAKAGYKRKDIEDLLAADDQQDQKDDDQMDQKDDDQQDQKDDDQPDQKDDDQQDQKDDDQPDQPDYKKLYEESQKEIKRIQARNRKDPGKATPNKTADDIALEHVNELFKGV